MTKNVNSFEMTIEQQIKWLKEWILRVNPRQLRVSTTMCDPMTDSRSVYDVPTE